MLKPIYKAFCSLFFVLTCVFTQAQNDLSISFKAINDSIKKGDTLVFEVLTKHEGGSTVSGGTQLQFNFQIGLLGSFNFNHVLAQNLQAGDSIVFNSPPFVLQQSGNLPFCLNLTLNSDTALENNTFCDTLWVEHPTRIFEHEKRNKSIFIRQNEIENRSNENIFITLYDLNGKLLEQKTIFSQSSFEFTQKRQNILIYHIFSTKGDFTESGKIYCH